MNMKLSDVCKIGVGMTDADFWLQRVGDAKTVGTPHRNLDMDDIGIKVIATDILYPDYLYYVMVYLHTQGALASAAVGIGQKMLTVKSISDMPLQQQG
jgi:hypothetical protein